MEGAKVVDAAPAERRGWQVMIVIGLVLLVIASALGVVYAKFQARVLFSELQALRQEKEMMDIEWGLLQLEQGTWAAHGRVDEIARRRLGMVLPEPRQVVIIKQ